MRGFTPDFKAVAHRTAIYEFRLGVDRRYTYYDLDRAILYWIGKLEAAGVKQGDFVAILSENRFEWVAVLYAVLAMDVVLIPLDSKSTATEWNKILTDANPQLLIVSHQFVESIGPLKLSFILLDDDRWRETRSTWSALPEPLPVNSENFAFIIYTSGTTGEPKGVMVPRRALEYQISRLTWKMNVKEREVFLSINPFNHLFELTCAVMTSVKNADELVICSSLFPEDILRLLRERSVTRMTVVPLFLRLMMNSFLSKAKSSGRLTERAFHLLRGISSRLPARSLRKRVHPIVKRVFGSRFKEFISGGAPLDPIVAEFFESLGIAVYQGYGMTESGPVIAVNNRNHNQLGSVGIPLPGSEIKVLKKNSDDESGEIWVRGPHIMLGYYKRTDLTNQVLVDGWLSTGDLGRVDAEGFLYVTGRNKDLIVLSGGKKVQPEEVEIALLRSSYFKEVCVLGVNQHCKQFGETVELTAIVVPHESMRDKGGEGELEEIIRVEVESRLKELAPYKRPSAVKIVWSELPKTSTRKVKRSVVLQSLLDGEV